VLRNGLENKDRPDKRHPCHRMFNIVQ